MKTFNLILAAALVFCLFFAGCIVNVVALQSPEISPVPNTLQLISIAFLGIYEVVVRVVPSVKNYSIISWLITALKTISDKLNVPK